jgi:small basic protein (TIGR04137 family)
MSQHPSLRSSEVDKKHRSVLKRYERVKSLKEKDKWKEEESVYGLPKVKILRFKIKKEKAAAAAVEGAEGAAAPAEGAAAPAATGKAAPAKEAAKTPAAEPKKEAKK